MKVYGLIGYPLSHSFSKEFFTRKFLSEHLTDTEYRNFPLEDIKQVRTLISEIPDLKGFNVTIPYKEKIIPYLDSLDPVAEEIGAVNTVKIILKEENKYLVGYNTDVYGFRRSLEETLGRRNKLTGALILGTGGASKAVAWVLGQLKIEYRFVSTSSRIFLHYDQLDENIIKASPLIINTTPLGTFPAVDGCPSVPFHFIGKEHVLFDLVYNPPLTLFLQNGKQRGAQVCNGFKMLEYQALKSWEIWNS